VGGEALPEDQAGGEAPGDCGHRTNWVQRRTVGPCNSQKWVSTTTASVPDSPDLAQAEEPLAPADPRWWPSSSRAVPPLPLVLGGAGSPEAGIGLVEVRPVMPRDPVGSSPTLAAAVPLWRLLLRDLTRRVGLVIEESDGEVPLFPCLVIIDEEIRLPLVWEAVGEARV
jgi:hypothetical protein